MKIGIAGVGGIGSNVAVNLVRSGILWLRIIDFDRVEPSNLNRQFYFHDQIGRPKVEALTENLRRIQPHVQIEAVHTRIDRFNCRSLLDDCELIVEGFDQPTDKKVLLEALGCDRIVVSACGIAGSDLTTIASRRIGTCYIAGDFTTDCADAPLYAHKVGTVANHMSAFILQLHGEQHGTHPR
jgi:sulfur carrier protein ThiS adenylyltransferase